MALALVNGGLLPNEEVVMRHDRQRRTKFVRHIVAAGLGSLVLFSQGVFREALAAGEKNIPDPSITAAVETHLLTDKSIPSRLINVETHNGIVTLSGSVDNILAKEQATVVDP